MLLRCMFGIHSAYKAFVQLHSRSFDIIPYQSELAICYKIEKYHSNYLQQ